MVGGGGFVDGSCGYRAGQYSGNIRFIEKPGIQDEGGPHVVKRSSDPRITHPEVKVQVRDLVRAVGIVAPFAPRGFSIREKSFYRAPESRSAQATCAGCP